MSFFLTTSKESEASKTKMVKITNKCQFERLVQLMEENVDIARGFIKSGSDFKVELRSRWEKIAEELNSLGPPSRDADGWMKVWTDLKFKVKKKKVHNNAERRATGGGPNKLFSFTPLEESVANLLNMDVAINPPGREFGSNSDNSAQNTSAQTQIQNTRLNTEVNVVPEEEENVTVHLPLPSEVEETTIRQPEVSTQKLKKGSDKLDIQGKRFQLLEKQTGAQENLYKEVKSALKEIQENTRENLKYTKKIYYLKQDKMKIAKENLKLKEETLSIRRQNLKDKQIHRREKLKLKTQILELQKKQIYIQQSLE